MANLRWEYKLSLIMMLLGIVFLVVMLTEWLYGLNYRDDLLQAINKPQQVDYQVEPLPEYTFLQNPVEHYAEIVNRPLFSKDRRPMEINDEPDDPGTVDEPPAKDFSLLLIGSMDTPEVGVVALFHDPKAKEKKDRFKHLAAGEIHLGWTVKSIQSDKVIVVANGKEKEITLRKASPAAIKKAPVRARRSSSRTKPKIETPKTPSRLEEQAQ